MGGVGSGGRRAGAGRKRKDPALKALGGNAGHRGRVLPHPSAAPSAPAATVAPPRVFDEADAPNDLSMDQRRIWMELAPIAVSRGIPLSDVQALPFRMLCQHVELARRYAASVAEAG